MSKDLLGGDYKKSSLFYATLAGIKRALIKFLKLPDFPIVHDNDKKIYMRKAENRKYPYAYMTIGSIGLREDMQALKTLRRHPVLTRVNMENSTVDAQFALPIKFTAELHYVTDDFTNAADFILHTLAFVGIEALNFTLKISEGYTLKIRMILDSKEISLPPADKELESDPNAHDISVSFTIESWHGEVKQLAKINNDGAVILGVELEDKVNVPS